MSIIQGENSFNLRNDLTITVKIDAQAWMHRCAGVRKSYLINLRPFQHMKAIAGKAFT